ncbi:hypothetical protein [Daejeonella sp.]|jgi:hypothetical protein|uniref:hypothetical protein n=1 Tax=Daejeonella sp. TaxID=2805397 RepID=UPI00378315AC
MKQKLLLFGLLIVFLFSFCNKKEKPQDLNVLKAKIQASQDFKNYQYSFLELSESMIRGEISTSGSNREIMNKAQNSKSLEEFTKYCEEAGIKGAKKYAELFYLQQTSLLNIVKNNPEMKQLTRNELKQILKFDAKPNVSIDDLNIK